MRAAPGLNHGARARISERRPPGRVESLVAWAHGPHLDRELADGVASRSSTLHAARALPLTGRRERMRLARGLAILIEHAQLPPGHSLGSGVVEPCRRQVFEAPPSIHAVSRRLRGAEPVRARDAARPRIPLSDGSGPCCSETRPATLGEAVGVVLGWLDTEE